MTTKDEMLHLAKPVSHAIAACAIVAATAATPQQHRRLFPPTDLGQLEGPDRDAYQRPDLIMDELQIDERSVVADLGAGGGWFTVRLARRVVNGKVYAEDIQPQMLEATKRRVDWEGLRNVQTVLGKPTDPGLPRESLDAVLIVDAYKELENPVVLLRNLKLSLKPDGRIGIVDFTREGGGPGPPMEDRVDPDRVIRDAEAAGLQLVSRPNFLRYHYMLVFERPQTTR